MKRRKWLCRLCAAAAAASAFTWFFPQTIFRDCVHAVLPQGSKKESERALTEEDFIDLFRLQKSNYKVTWKFFQND